MFGEANRDAAELSRSHVPAANTAATRSVTGVSGMYVVIDSIDASYDTTPAAGKKLNVTFGAGATEKWAVYLPAGGVGIGPHNFTFPRGLYTGTLADGAVVTLEAGGVGISGSIAYTYRLVHGPANPDAMELNSKSVVAANSAAVCTIAADANQFWCLDSIHGGFDGDPGAAKKLNVTFGGVEVWAVDFGDALANSGPHEFLFPRGLYTGTKNEAMVVTLEASAAAGAALSITYR